MARTVSTGWSANSSRASHIFVVPVVPGQNNPPQSLRDFQGQWQLQRHIHDRLTGSRGDLRGTARFTLQDEHLLYEETGCLNLDGQTPMTAFRRYLWKQAEPRAINVCYSDGEFFHTIFLAQSRPQATHICAADRYHVAYDFRRWPQWQTDWSVTGPRKDYQLCTICRPAFL